MSGEIDERAAREMAARGQTLMERLSGDRELESTGRVDTDPAAVLSTWRNQFSDEEAFTERLEVLGTSEQEVRTALQGNIFAESEPIPEWVQQAVTVAEWVGSQNFETVLADSPSDPTDRPAFWAVTRAVGQYVREHAVPEAATQLSEDVLDQATRWFEQRFHSRFLRVLFVEFKRFVAVHDESLAFADPAEYDDLPTTHFEQFRAYLLGDGFADLCYDYPMFARLLTVQIRQWTDHLREFVQRLNADREHIAETFTEGQLGRVVELEPLADDTHGDGRAVMRVEFESGTVVVYKPRSVAVGKRFHETLEEICRATAVPSFDTPDYVVSDGYGWMEWVEREDCESESAVERYYERAGALTAVAYLFEFTDCHYENTIAAGETPVLIDAETVFHPYIDPDRDSGKVSSEALSSETVLLSLLLPYEDGQPHGSPSKLPTKVAGIGVSTDSTKLRHVKKPRVQAPNTDVMSVEHEHPEIERTDNIPAVDGDPRLPDAYLDNILDGFEEVYELALTDAVGPNLTEVAESFASIENRVIYRPTRQYGSLLRSLVSRDPLQSGLQFGATVEELATRFATAVDPLWGIYDGERTAVERLDPPRFTSHPGSTTVYGPDGATGETADETGVHRAVERIRAADRADLRQQRELIRAAFGERPAEPRSVSDDHWCPVSDEELYDAAIEAYETVREAASVTTRGRYDWASVAPWYETDRLRIRPGGHSLYVGRPGIALFAAALYAHSGRESHASFARDAIAPTVRAVEGTETPAVLQRHGGTFGLGSVVYALATTGDLLEEPSLLETAVTAGNTVTAEFVQRDDAYDVVSGSAGTLLGLLSAAERTDDPALLNAAKRCGNHVVESATRPEPGVATWDTLDTAEPLTGFAHGTAGIAYALTRLADVTGRDQYRETALDAVGYETLVYDESTNNWPDYREDSGHTHTDQWCHGRSGIGLARVGMNTVMNDERVSRGLERALSNFEEDTLRPYDHLCCGNAGRAELLIAAERHLNRRSGEARRLLGGVLDTVESRASYRTASGTRAIPDPTLFHGQAGIGYTLLRAIDPERIPSVLLWE